MNLLCTLLCTLLAAAPAPLTLIADGQARCAVVVPDRASPTVTHAAEELAAYLERISGAKLAVVAEGRAGTGTRIDVGPTALARKTLPADAAKNGCSCAPRPTH